ncbi:MAG: hypothetical protein K0M45_03320 [Candidatus Paracaedibacteraceae bacterium]|nr:hypothetical protein [Candidatus Paracaedibacteraceae bacterium]
MRNNRLLTNISMSLLLTFSLTPLSNCLGGEHEYHFPSLNESSLNLSIEEKQRLSDCVMEIVNNATNTDGAITLGQQDILNKTCDYLIEKFSKVGDRYQEDKEKTSTIVIGDSGEGKTSLMHWLNGSLEITQNEFTEMVLKTRNWTEIYGAIQLTSDSGTLIPEYWKIGPNLFWDCPGFNDTRGVIQELENSFYIHHLLAKKHSRVVVVTSHSSVVGSSRGVSFKELLKRLASTFINKDTLKKCLTVVITKTPTLDVKVYKAQFQHMAAKSSLSNSAVKELLEYLGSEESRIALFPSPVKGEDYHYGEQKQLVLSQIESARANTFFKDQLNITLTRDCKDFIAKLAATLNSKITMLISNNFLQLVKEYCEAVISLKDEMENLRVHLNNIAQSIPEIKEDKPDLDLLLSGLTGSKGALAKLVENSKLEAEKRVLTKELKEVIKFIQFLKTLDHQLHFDQKTWKDSLSYLKGCIHELAEEPKADWDNEQGTVAIKGFLISIKEVKDLVTKFLSNQRLSPEALREIHIYALHTAFIDESMQYAGKNLALLAPQLRRLYVEGKIDLSGRDGGSFTKTERARDGEKGDTDNLNGKKGMDGEDGGNGLPGGHFYCLTEKSKQEYEYLRSIVKVDGGRGENGQNGGHGGSGANGNDGSLDAVINRTIPPKASQMASKSGAIQGAVQFVKSLAFYEEDEHCTYESAGTQGGNGGNGGNGGAAGAGGSGGTVVFKFLDTREVDTSSGTDGQKGQAGKPGGGGKAGKHGLTHRGVYRRAGEFQLTQNPTATVFNCSPLIPLALGAISPPLSFGIVAGGFAGRLVLGKLVSFANNGASGTNNGKWLHKPETHSASDAHLSDGKNGELMSYPDREPNSNSKPKIEVIDFIYNGFSDKHPNNIFNRKRSREQMNPSSENSLYETTEKAHVTPPPKKAKLDHASPKSKGKERESKY